MMYCSFLENYEKSGIQLGIKPRTFSYLEHTSQGTLAYSMALLNVDMLINHHTRLSIIIIFYYDSENYIKNQFTMCNSLYQLESAAACCQLMGVASKRISDRV